VVHHDQDAALDEERRGRLSVSLARLAYNLRWAWEPRVAQVFEALAPATWCASHNPVTVVRARRDEPSLARHAAHIEAAAGDLADYLTGDVGAARLRLPRIAYLCAEFAIAECLPIYAGGLGVLAGDHLKAASDLGLPLIGVGLLYRYGYFRQTIDATGQQRECYDATDPSDLPLRPVVWGDGRPLHVAIPFTGRSVYARVWRADVGRIPLYLLDTDVGLNRDDDRWITAHAYGGDQDTRIRQEIVLGIGGARLLRALRVTGLEPTPAAYHLNEGHSAFLILDLVHEAIRQGTASTFHEALVQVAQRVVFTTHTPVAAGHDVFGADLIEAHLGEYRQQLGVTRDALMRLAQPHGAGAGDSFSMTVLALHGAARRNAVSRLHARISRGMWARVGVGVNDEPPAVAMAAVTNGVHGPTWVGREMSALFDRWIGQRWRTAAREAATWAPLADVPFPTLWAARSAQRARLLERADVAVDPSTALVVGFARRFASYKRAALLLEDTQRLATLMTSATGRELVIVFAGKAHPNDDEGKQLVQRVVATSRQEPFVGRLVYLENYDVELARLMVQGSDIWLNTPRRPLEASGTSGMKAVLNGALHLSELDGWWDEAYRPDLGWALGRGIAESVTDGARDLAEARELLNLLELQILPLFFARDQAGVPRDWLARVVRSILVLAPTFSAERMVLEYAEQMYVPAMGIATPAAPAVRATNRCLVT
jgi:glycogen phosphorylase